MIAKALKELRAAHKITQFQLANIVGVSQQAVAKWEKDKSDPDNAILLKIAKYFNVSIDYLFDSSFKQNKEVGLSELAINIENLPQQHRDFIKKFIKASPNVRNKVVRTIEGAELLSDEIDIEKNNENEFFKIRENEGNG